MQLPTTKIPLPEPFTCSAILHKFLTRHDITIANVATKLFFEDVFIVSIILQVFLYYGCELNIRNYLFKNDFVVVVVVVVCRIAREL